MTRKDLKKTFYLIALYNVLGELQGFVKIGDNKEEITDYFERHYLWKPGDFGVTEDSYQLLEVNAKELMNDKDYLLIKGR